MQKFLLNILIFSAFSLPVSGQVEGLSNFYTKKVEVSAAGVELDSLSVVPASVEVMIEGEKLDSSFYVLDKNKLIAKEPLVNRKIDSVLVRYRTLPYNLGAVFTHLDSTKAKVDQDGRIIGFNYNPYEKQESGLIEFQGLNYNGTFARGISFGNNQNLVLNSSFNLQLAGNLGDGVEVLAAISDNNIPLQPEGNTQQLNEFDKIFVQISKDNNRLTAGDYELGVRPPDSYFMNYFKKMQGATFSNESEVFKKKGILETNASIAISRGKTARNNIVPQEGNQGPYRLEGSEGERFIIVLAGTERVWIDGKLLKRGIEEDYVIDYNAGDITFTQRQLITKDSRIIIDFEYSDQNYVRSMYAVGLDYQQGDKLRMYFNVFSEQDGKQPVDDDFSETELERLVNAGDNLFLASVSGIDTVADFSSFRVLYKLVPNPDSLCNGLSEKLVFSSDPDSALYAGRFSLVGTGQGYYAVDNETIANGTVYKYVGCGNGDYISEIQLITPKQQQLYTMGLEYELSKNSRIRTELALSRIDQNRLSSIDDNDNVGLAAFTNFENDFDIGKKGNWRLETDLSYEHVQQRFEDLNPYRPAEFRRDWSINSTDKVREQIGSGALRLRHRNLGDLHYRFSGFYRDSVYTGNKHVAGYSLRKKNGLSLNLEGNLLTVAEPDEESSFFRPKFDLSLPFLRDSTGKKFWLAGVSAEREKNQRYDKFPNEVISDTLNPNSFFFDVFNVFVETPKSDKLNLRAKVRQRRDYAPVKDDFEESSVGTEFNIQSTLRNRRKSKKGRRFSSNLGLNFSYRELVIKDTLLTNQMAAETYLGRLNYLWNLFDGAIQTNSSYEIKSGQERKVEFLYEQVEPGTGTYIWQDSNQDSIVQDYEVIIAPFPDVANVVRFARFTDEFLRTNNVTFNQVLRLEPKAIWFREKKGFKKFLTKFSTQSSLQIVRKVRDLPDVNPWNPFDLEVSDTSLVATNSNIRNTIFFNKGNRKFDLQLGSSNVGNKQFLSSGFDSRQVRKQFFRSRWNVTKSISTNLEVALGERRRVNEASENDSYNIQSEEMKAGLSWLSPKKNFRTIVSYRFEGSENIFIENGETAQKHEFEFSSKFNKSSKTSIEAEFSFVKVDFSGEANSSVGFAFLNGLQNGNNFLWNLTLDQRLAKNIQLRIGYEGRKTGTGRIVHVGSAQMAATF